MTNPFRYALLTMLKLVDLAVVGAAFTLAVVIEMRPQPWLPVLEMRIEVRNALFVLAFLGYCHLAMRTVGLYRSYRLTAVSREWRDLAKVVLATTGPLVGAGVLFGFDYATTSFGTLFACMTFLGLAVERRAFRVLARTVRRHGRNIRNVVIVGHDERASIWRLDSPNAATSDTPSRQSSTCRGRTRRPRSSAWCGSSKRVPSTRYSSASLSTRTRG